MVLKIQIYKKFLFVVYFIIEYHKKDKIMRFVYEKFRYKTQIR
jgi:hypothetical protein